MSIELSNITIFNKKIAFKSIWRGKHCKPHSGIRTHYLQNRSITSKPLRYADMWKIWERNDLYNYIWFIHFDKQNLTTWKCPIPS